MSIDSTINQGMKPWHKLLLLLAPFLSLGIYIALGHTWITQRGIDPYIYTGYIRSYAILLEDFGYTYYSNRLSHLIPSMLFIEWFGDWRGYQIYRLVLWSAGFWGSWMLARKFISGYWSLAIATLFVFHPWFNASLFWEHYDSTAIVWLLWLLVCIVQVIHRLQGAQRLSVGWLLGGGLCYLFAGNANSYLLGVGGLFWASAFLVVFVYRGFRKAVWFQFWGAIGFILGYVALVLILNLILYPNPEGWYYDLLSILMSLTFFDGGGVQWHRYIWEFVLERRGYYALLPLAVTGAVCYQCLLSLRHREKLADAWMVRWFTAINLILVTALFLTLDIVFRAAVINLFFYFVYWLPATFLGGLLLCQIICESMPIAEMASRVRLWKWSVAIAVGITLLVPVLLAQSSIATWTTLYIVLIGVLFIAIWVLLGKQFSIRRQGLAVIAGLALAVSIPLFNLASHRSYPTEDQQQIAKEQWMLVIEFAQLFEEVREPGERYMFWYNEDGLFDAINSYYLWGYSRLRSSGNGEGDFSKLKDEEKMKLKEVQQLILLGHSPQEIEAGVTTLDREGWQWTLQKEGKIGGDRVHCYYKILRLKQEL